jgi:hypothetical protein
MMQALQVPGRMPQAQNLRQGEMLQALFSALPEGSMLKALEAVGIQVREPQSYLAPDDESNAISSWNDRRVVLNGADSRGPIYNKQAVVEMAPTISRVPEAPYLSPEYDTTVGMMSTMNNAQGGY